MIESILRLKRIAMRSVKTIARQFSLAPYGDEDAINESPISLEGTRIEYIVKADGFDAGEYTLTFRNRQMARDYKRLLADSNRQLKGRVTRIAYDDGFVVDEREIS